MRRTFGRAALLGILFGNFIPYLAFGGSNHSPNWAREEAAQLEAQREVWCKNLEKAVQDFGWKVPVCVRKDLFRVGGQSILGRPLVYFEFGPEDSDNTTLVLTMVHPDENTPLYLGLKLIEWLHLHPQDSPGARVIIAPLVNPDGFYLDKRTRYNARGVDLNRNFHTRDWKKSALALWKQRFRSDPRRNPGASPNSEPETIFQRNLIYRFRPNKILSIHAPLNFMDYDGPNVLTLKRFPNDYVRECLRLRSKVHAVSGGYFVGSLGNYAGQERGIPTLTLELPTANPDKANSYWEAFKKGMHAVVEFRVPDYNPAIGAEAGNFVFR